MDYRIKLVLVLLCVWGSPSHAFERVAGGNSKGPNATEAGPLELTPGKSVKGSKNNGGLVIPGLGSLGVLPKLDFGLELLYGENQQQRIIEPEQDASETDGLRIKGTLKHRF